MNVLVAAAAFVMLVGMPVLALNVPLVIVVLLLRERLNQHQRQILLATGFGAASAYRFWRLWFFDVLPSPAGPPERYYATTIIPWGVAFAVAEWTAGSALKLKT